MELSLWRGKVGWSEGKRRFNGWGHSWPEQAVGVESRVGSSWICIYVGGDEATGPGNVPRESVGSKSRLKTGLGLLNQKGLCIQATSGLPQELPLV